MIDRFLGADGERRVRQELGRQAIVENNLDLANELATAMTLHSFAAGEKLVEQGGTDSHLDFILAGSVAIEVFGKMIARRESGLHVGELAMIDPSATRSATVRALEQTVVARVEEVDFQLCADRHPHMLRALVREVARRLRERGRYVRPRNASPVLFVGSTVEALPFAQALQEALAGDDIDVRLWTDDNIFVPGHHPSEDLRLVAEATDFAVLWATPDDVVEQRGIRYRVPRDNILVEVGLFIGVLDRERTFVIRPRGIQMKVPSDYLGLTALEYDPAGTPLAAGGLVGEAVRRRVRALGAR